MTRAHPGIVVRASAGTGKTHRLAVRCIELMAAGEGIDRILATTFTRKAAGEIRERVVLMLARAARGDARTLAAIGERVKGFGAADAARVLEEVIARLHRVQIMTIDSLASRMATMAQLEIGLAPGWRVIDDVVDARVRAAALERVMDELQPAAMTPLMAELQAGELRATVHATVMDLVSSGERAWRVSDGDPSVWDTVPALAGRLDAAALAGAVDRMAAAPVAVVTGKGEPNRNWVRGHERAVEMAREEEWEGFVSGGLGAIAEEGTYYKVPMPEEMREAYLPVVRHARAVIVDRHRAKTAALARVLERFAPIYERMKRDLGVVRFEDVPRALAERADVETRESMYFRMDTRYRHVLLDEFQDTSAEQFGLVEPMVAEILAGGGADGRSVLIVGDPKQTLYSWRNAAPGLMDEVVELWPEGFGVEEMHKSRRSSPAVIECVNEVFGRMDGLEVLAGSDAAKRFAAGYVEHTSARPELGGTVIVREVGNPDAKGDEEEDAAAWVREAADAVERIREELGDVSIGVLTRKGDSAGKVIAVLRGRGIFASAERGTALGDTPAVAGFASLLTLIDHPGHTMAAYHVAMSPVGKAVGLDAWADAKRVRWVIDRERRFIADHGFGALAARVARACAQDMDARSMRRFEQAVEMCEAFDRDPPDRIDEVATRLWETPVEDPSGERVRVMTVHASKGLEFDAVVLPELGDKWSVRPGEVLVDHPDPLRRARAVTAYGNEIVRECSPEVARIHAAVTDRKVMEGICTLYVAMTRARVRVEMILPPMTKAEREGTGTSTLSAARVIREALGCTEGPGVVWEHRSGDGGARVEGGRMDEERRIDPPRFTAPGGVRPAWRADRTSPSGSSKRREGIGRVGKDSGGAARVGEMVHAWFEGVEWAEDARLDADALVRTAPGFGVDEAWAREEAARFAAAVGSPGMATALSRARVADRLGGMEIEVRRELPFMARTDDGRTVVSGRFDRVVIGREGGRVARVEIVDYKTDAVEGEVGAWAEDRRRAHAEQMRGYRRAASAMFGVPEERVAVHLALVRAGMVVEA